MGKLLLFLIVQVFISVNIFAQAGTGYADKQSVAPGDTIRFYISGDPGASSINISIMKWNNNTGGGRQLISSYNNIPVVNQPVPDSAWYYGCNWTETFSLVIPSDWAPGGYSAEYAAATNPYGAKIFFVVRPAVSGSYSNVLMVTNTNTWQAYNAFGGKNLYPSESPARGHKVSFLRPSHVSNGMYEFHKQELSVISWAAGMNIPIELCTDYDFDRDPTLAQNYDVIMFAGHAEYWTHNQRQQLHNFVQSGGKLMIMSGNVCWWQVRFEENGTRMICYKDASLDPLTGVTDSLVTINWFNPPVNKPENTTIGTSFKHGGYVNRGTVLPASDGYSDYAAYNTHHWIFKNTGLKEGDEWGLENTIGGVEVDGVLFDWVNGIPVVTGADQTPMNFRIFGLTPADRNGPSPTPIGDNGVVGMYFAPNHGAVFNAASIDWADGLVTGDPTRIITENVLRKFIENRFPPEIMRWAPADVSETTINNRTMQINNRSIALQEGESAELSLYAEDPYNAPVSYFWQVNGAVVSGQTDTSFNFTNSGYDDTLIVVTAFAYNNEDTASISWEIINLDALPVELVSFSARVLGSSVELRWQTATELDNFGFEVERRTLEDKEWSMIKFIKGNGNSSTVHDYSFTDNSPSGGSVFLYRLKQLDNSGAFTYSEEIEVNMTPSEYSLSQNYPNPFNPTTKINFSIPIEGVVRLSLYNVLGEKVQDITEQFYTAGNHVIEFNGSAMPSGFYFFQIKAGNFTATKRMMLLK